MPEARYRKAELTRFRQGDIVRDVVVLEAAEIDQNSDELNFVERHIPYCVLLSQDCDLEHDFNSRGNDARNNHDKFLPSVLLSPAYLAEEFKVGEQLKDLQLKMMSFSSRDWERLKKNHLYRYHFLPNSQDLQVPDLVVDFKHFFTVQRESFYRDYKDKLVASLEVLFREDFSNRFAYYLSRIGLPEVEAT